LFGHNIDISLLKLCTDIAEVTYLPVALKPINCSRNS